MLKYKNIVIALILTMFFVLDRYLKFLALKIDKDHDLIKGALSFSFHPNKYIAFSLPLSGPILNIVIFILLITIFCFLIYFFKKRRNIELLSFLAIFLGALSNFIDRIKFSYVVDYLDLRYFTVFNLADFLIFIACVNLTFFYLRK